MQQEYMFFLSRNDNLWSPAGLVNVYVDGNIGNLALPVMPRQYQKFFHKQGPVRELTYPNLTLPNVM